MPSPQLVHALETELEQTRKQIGELGSYADHLEALIPAKASRNSGRKRKPATAKRKGVSPEKVDALDAHLRRTIPDGQPFTVSDLEGWEGFAELGISGSTLRVGLQELVRQRRLQQAKRNEYVDQEKLGPRTKVYRIS